MCSSESPWVVLKAFNAMHHAFVEATNTKLDAFAKAHELAREQQRKRGGEIQFGVTKHELPPAKGTIACDYVSVEDDSMWVVFEA